MALTKLENLVNPQVMSDMISAKVEKKIVVTPFAKIDTTLQGNAGDKITVPAFAYIGDAVDVAEGGKLEASTLTATSIPFGVKKAMKSVMLTDEAVLSGYGNPVGEATTQLAKAIASKVDSDAMEALTTVYDKSSAPYGVQKKYDPATAVSISYAGIVNAVDTFEEEVQSDKVMFIHPKQVTQLRLDKDFISADKYDNAVMMHGEIGMIAGVRIVPSKKVKTTGDGTSAKYLCPIIKLNSDAETEDDASALTIFLKRDTNVETERHTTNPARTTEISVDKIYGVAITNQEKVCLAYYLATPVA